MHFVCSPPPNLGDRPFDVRVIVDGLRRTGHGDLCSLVDSVPLSRALTRAFVVAWVANQITF